MVVLVRLRVNVESQRKLPVTLQPSTLIITLQRLLQIAFAVLRRQAFCFLLVVLARTSNKNLVLARLALITSIGRVALVRARMAAAGFLLSARLPA